MAKINYTEKLKFKVNFVSKYIAGTLLRKLNIVFYRSLAILDLIIKIFCFVSILILLHEIIFT